LTKIQLLQLNNTLLTRIAFPFNGETRRVSWLPISQVRPPSTILFFHWQNVCIGRCSPIMRIFLFLLFLCV